MAKQKQELYAEYAYKIVGQLTNLFDEDSEYYIDPEKLKDDDHAKAFTHALANVAPCMIYNHIGGVPKNNLEFNHLANHLCFEFCKPIDSNEQEG